MRKTIFCKHYRAMSDHATCEAGVDYAKFQGVKYEDRPCFFRQLNRDTAPVPRPGCDLVVLPTLDEIEAEEAEANASFARVGTARQAIVTHLGAPWKRGMPGANGVIDCPVCKGHKTLSFSRAGYNGHIHARCSSANCVSWME